MANRAAHLLARARETGEKTALVYCDERISFAYLADRVHAAAAMLRARGIGAGTHVGILIPASPEFIVVQQALFLLGAIVSPLNTFYQPGEVAHVVRSCDLAFVVTHSTLADRVPDGTDSSLASLHAVILCDRDLQPTDDAAPPIEAARVAPDDVVVLLNTSATTGKSKGVMLTAANLAANYDRTPEWLGLTGEDVILCALPLYNTFGLNQCINAMLVTGATMVLLPRFEATKCVEAIEVHRCTFLPAVPTMLQKIVDQPGLGPNALSSISRVMTGGAPVPAALLRRVLDTMGAGVEVLTGYGLTEGTALVTLTAVRLGSCGELDHRRSIGKVLDGMTLQVRAEDGRLVGPDAVGEFVVRGPNVMAGYYRAKDDTAAALADGWLHTGDVGYIDSDGYAFIVDRKKDIIIRGGQNIYPADIEEALYQLPGVAEVGVIGMADDMLGEVPVAFVALKPGTELTESAMLAHCKARLAHFKMPAAIHLLPELPKGPTGKILRRALRPAVPVAA